MRRARWSKVLGRGSERGLWGVGAASWLIPSALAATLLIGSPRDGTKAHADAACPAAEGETVDLDSVESRLELRLRDGRLIRLAGLDPALSTPSTPDRDEEARRAFAALIAGHSIRIRPLATQPDRWGRIVALAFVADAPSDGQPGGLAGAAIAAGLGRYLAEPPAHGCRSALLAAEDSARAAKLGLWDDPYYGLLAVDDRAGFAERAGTVVVVEARVAAVQSDPYRTKLLLWSRGTGSHGSQTLWASILPRTMKTFEANGVHVTSLIGQTLRLRGLLDTRFGPQIELATPDDLDVIEAGPPALTAGSK